MADEQDQHDDRRAREARREDDEPLVGAEGGERSARTGAPFASHPDDDSPLWDTDQHSRTAREGTDPGDRQGMRGG